MKYVWCFSVSNQSEQDVGLQNSSKYCSAKEYSNVPLVYRQERKGKQEEEENKKTNKKKN